MLFNLHIKNFAIITESEVEFGDGLNVLTGETGAGKSILIGAVNMALGAKVSKDIIRNGADFALAELVFETDDEVVFDKLKEYAIEPNGGQIIISRKILINGRSILKINGENMPTPAAKEIAALLLDIHGQHEHQSLLNKQKHIELVDSYAGNEILDVKTEVSSLYREYMQIFKELEEADIDEETRKREISFMDYEINEISEAALKPDEDTILEERFKLLSNARNICEGIEAAKVCINGDNESISGFLSMMIKTFSKLSSYDDKLKDFYERMLDLDSFCTDLGRDIEEFSDRFENSEEEFEEVSERLDLINRLKLKYGNTVAEITAYKEEKEEARELLLRHEEHIAELKSKLEKAETNLKEKSDKLSKLRKKYAKVLCEQVKKALIELNFLDVRFEMRFNIMTKFSANGIDDAQFYIATNPGSDMMPLIKVASGGEMSRIMLAIKSVLADKDNIGALIFDEIDVGVSGRTAQKVAERMAEISHSHQVICITHLPQIAAMADNHFLIEKCADGKGVKTEIRKLSEEEQCNELARILGGAEVTDTVVKSALEMKELAKKYKLSIK